MRTELISSRKAAGLTQQQIADLAQVDRSYYTHIERGDRHPSLSLAIRIARILNKRVEDIFLIPDVAKRHNTNDTWNLQEPPTTQVR